MPQPSATVRIARTKMIVIRCGSTLLADATRIRRAYLACREDLVAEPFKVPRALQALAEPG